MLNIPENEKELYLIAEIAAKNLHGRKIVLWGNDNNLRAVLKKYFGLKVEFVVTILRDIVNGKSIRDLEELRGKSSEYYMIAWGRNYEEKYHKLLNSYGYEEITDFVYRRMKPIVIENWDCAKGKYQDQFGNVIHGSAGIIKKVVLKGYNNRIYLDKNIYGIQNLEFEMGANCEVWIREGCGFGGSTKFRMLGFDGSSRVYIDRRCQFLSSSFKMYNHPAESCILIDEDCTFGENLALHANSGKRIVIGRDCMFSFDIQLQAGDGHAIFDVKTGKNTNSIYKKEETLKNMIVLGEHVWVSSRAFILNGTNIGSGSIIGGNSTVKGVYPNNCVVAGNPAKKVKEDCAWSRYNGTEDISTCGQKNYAALTCAAAPAISGKDVLVVGGTRFIGIRLVRELLAKGNRVTIATRGNTKDYFGTRINRVVMDLEKPETVRAVLDGKYFDVVFDNLAYCSNYVKNLLSVVKCGRYIQLSSAAVYVPKKLNLTETDFMPHDIIQEWSNPTENYAKGKRQAEAAVYKQFPEISAVTVRIPYVTKTERLLYYCRNVVAQKPMRIDDTGRELAFISAAEVGRFLPWIAAQDFKGPINLASTDVITIQEIIDYIEEKAGKKAIIDKENGEESPFQEQSFSINMAQAEKVGYITSKINDWFWKLMDEYIARAIRENESQAITRENSKNASDISISCVDREKCTGCGACMNICPKDAIKMQADQEGFLIPEISYEKCIHCGLCKKICPTLANKSYIKEHVSCYAVMAHDDVRMVSSSGGAFTLLAEQVLEQGGVVCGAAWTEDYRVKHVIVKTKEELRILRGSKYVQSDTSWMYRETKKLLDQGQKVLYTGMPCQIDGLLHYLQKDYDNLITVDLLCRGIASNELFKRFVEENYKGQKIAEISFKDKKPLGWGATTSYKMINGDVEKTNIHNSIWMCAYLANVMDRNSCYTCKFNTAKRVGDISIGDFWGIDKYNKSFNDTKGTSIVITSTEKGEALVNNLADRCKLLAPVPIENGIPYNSALCSHVKKTPKRELFFDSVRKMPVPAAVDRTIYGEKYGVGIVGWWYNLNYGGTITYYGLNQAIKKLGYSVLMIRRSSSSPNMPNDNTVPMRFAKKHYNISRIYTAHDMHWINYSCHAFISGSDQLWNPYLQVYSGPEFFLSFVNQHNLKISYASSFGNIDELSDEFKEHYGSYLKRFDAISVREDYAVDICKRDLDIDVVQVCDPIFLCNADDYKAIAMDSQLKLPERYMMNFLLDPNEDKVNGYRFLQEKLKIVENINFTDLQNVSDRESKFGGEKVYGNAEIEDFVKVYANADFVVTDSFHGTCLAIIFNKPFVSIANKERGEKRFISLLKWLNLSERLIFDISEIYSREDLFQPVDFSNANKVIRESQKKGYEWLNDILKKMV